jgi:hypothetical protein
MSKCASKCGQGPLDGRVINCGLEALVPDCSARKFRLLMGSVDQVHIHETRILPSAAIFDDFIHG